MTYYIGKTASGKWRWTLTAGNGKRIACAPEDTTSREDCRKAVELVKATAPDAPVVVEAGQ